MGGKDNLNEFYEVKLDIKEKIKDVTGEIKKFPKYTTQIINIANQNAQGTRPEVVGQMSELIKQCPEKTFKVWKEWYLKTHPNAIDDATKRIYAMIKNMNDAMNLITEEMVKEWVEDLVLTKTAEGLIIQEIILKYLAEQSGVKWRTATPEEESKNIDGYIGERPVQIKPTTYLSKKSSVRDTIEAETVYYKRTDKYLYIYTK